jgi:nucleotide-binding universal stress UspA family protein
VESKSKRSGLASVSGDFWRLLHTPVEAIAAIGEAGDPCARETAEALAARLGATITERASSDVDLLVVGSRPGTVTGRVTISAAAEYLIELSSCPVVVVPRGVTVRFGS